MCAEKLKKWSFFAPAFLLGFLPSLSHADGLPLLQKTLTNGVVGSANAIVKTCQVLQNAPNLTVSISVQGPRIRPRPYSQPIAWTASIPNWDVLVAALQTASQTRATAIENVPTASTTVDYYATVSQQFKLKEVAGTVTTLSNPSNASALLVAFLDANCGF